MSPRFFSHLRLRIFALMLLSLLLVQFALLITLAAAVGRAFPTRYIWFSGDYRIGMIDIDHSTVFFYPDGTPLRPDLPIGQITIPTGHTLRTFTYDLTPVYSRAMPVENLAMDCDIWSSNAAYLLCKSTLGSPRIYIFSAYGDHLPILRIESPDALLNAVFSPDSTQLAVTFSTESPEQTAVYVYALSNGSRTLIGEYSAPEMRLSWAHDLTGALPNTFGGDPIMITLIEADTPPFAPPIDQIVIDRRSQRDFWLNENELLLLTTRSSAQLAEIVYQLEYLRLDPPVRRTLYIGTALRLFHPFGVQSGTEYTILDS